MTSDLQAGATPADKVIAAFGGVRKTACILKRNASSVSRWRKPVEEGGTGGRVPSNVQTAALEAAQELGVDLSPGDLILLPA